MPDSAAAPSERLVLRLSSSSSSSTYRRSNPAEQPGSARVAFSSGVAATGVASHLLVRLLDLSSLPWSAPRLASRDRCSASSPSAPPCASSGFGSERRRKRRSLSPEPSPRPEPLSTRPLQPRSLPHPVPVAVSSGPAGSELRGACPYRTFSRFTFAACGVAPGCTSSRAPVVAVAVVVAAVRRLAADRRSAPGPRAAPSPSSTSCPGQTASSPEPSSSSSAGGAYAVNTGLVCFGLAPESTYPARISMYASSRSFVR